MGIITPQTHQVLSASLVKKLFPKQFGEIVLKREQSDEKFVHHGKNKWSEWALENNSYDFLDHNSNIYSSEGLEDFLPKIKADNDFLHFHLSFESDSVYTVLRIDIDNNDPNLEIYRNIFIKKMEQLIKQMKQYEKMSPNALHKKMEKMGKEMHLMHFVRHRKAI